MIQYNTYVLPNEVYLYTLKTEGQNPFYVGKTINPTTRYISHISGTQHHSNKKKNAIIQTAKKEGKSIIMTVFWSGTSGEWKSEEKFWIAKFKYDWEISIVNIHSGGDGVCFTDEIRNKISKAHRGKKLSQTTRDKMKLRIPWNKGMQLNETKEVCQLSLSGDIINTFSSIKQAGESLNINRGCLSLVLNNKRKTIGGYRWRYKN